LIELDKVGGQHFPQDVLASTVDRLGLGVAVLRVVVIERPTRIAIERLPLPRCTTRSSDR
jgi:hypothetical protein